MLTVWCACILFKVPLLQSIKSITISWDHAVIRLQRGNILHQGIYTTYRNISHSKISKMMRCTHNLPVLKIMFSRRSIPWIRSHKRKFSNEFRSQNLRLLLGTSRRPYHHIVSNDPCFALSLTLFMTWPLLLPFTILQQITSNSCLTLYLMWLGLFMVSFKVVF